jgi:micrococcal nuclease
VRHAAAALVVATLAAGCADGTGEAESAPRERATVEWVVDGDTLRLRDGRTVRLLQIDAPEARRECFWREATRALIDRTPRGTQVVLVRDPGLDAVDAYDRLLRYVVVEGTNVNVALVRAGAAMPYFFRNARGTHAGTLLAAMRSAREARRGLWAACPRARSEPGLGSDTGPAATQRR